MAEAPTLIIGAGIGGLASAALLSARGVEVIVLEKEAAPGGKVRQLPVGETLVDAGPTVFTMRSVIDEIFRSSGGRTEDHLTLTAADTLARHAWNSDGHLDLFGDHGRSVDSIGRFAGAKAAEGFRSFSAEAKRIFEILDQPMLRGSKVSWPLPLMWRIGLWRMGALRAIRPYESVWKALGEHFEDARLRQLFGRYTTYCGSSPFQSPATLMLIAHVEAQGVWKIKGGLTALANALETRARQNGAVFRYNAPVDAIHCTDGRASAVSLVGGERISAAAVICNADPAALGAGLFGPDVKRAAGPPSPANRSLSAMVWLAHSEATGFPLEHHNVFFSSDYPAEFAALKAGGVPENPSVYVCALDDARPEGSRRRLQVIVNAPANGDTHNYSAKEQDQCTSNMLSRLRDCGLHLETPLTHRLVTPNDFSKLFPATGGALYGRASHGWAASFLRPGSRTRIRGLYCAGGATHPGAGVPMAALSGKLASEAVLSDRISTQWYHRGDITGGMSMRSATMAGTG
ncbi:MAG: 1-hydroxycarotenoid 3,4-desaturase CrtD [Tsuneonella sp.]